MTTLEILFLVWAICATTGLVFWRTVAKREAGALASLLKAYAKLAQNKKEAK